jgi:hypothetical protein
VTAPAGKPIVKVWSIGPRWCDCKLGKGAVLSSSNACIVVGKIDSDGRKLSMNGQ